MDDKPSYAVFLFPQALEALGDAVKPYLQDSKGGPHVLCHEIDTGGALIEMTLGARSVDGEPVELQLMLPTSMVRMIVSVRSEDSFGFTPHPIPAVTDLPSIRGAGEASPPADDAAKPEAGEGATP